MQKLDRSWLSRNPLPPIRQNDDKNARGRVLVVGGGEFVPGALRLTGEAALRAGAGKLQLATVRAAAMALAVSLPEAAMIALPSDEDGELAPAAGALLEGYLTACDAVVLGPGMSETERTDELIAAILRMVGAEQTVVLDAAALTSVRNLQNLLSEHPSNVIMTPHYGEMCKLTGLSFDAIAHDPGTIAQRIADDFGTVVALKGVRTLVACPGEDRLLYEGGSPGLATSGSGDVLAGLIGGLAARGAPPRLAASWGVCVHGAASERLSREVAELGFLARELLPLIPGCIAELSGS